MGDFTTRLRKSAGGFMYSFIAQDAGGAELFKFEATRLQPTRGGLLADIAVYTNISTARVVPSPRSGFVTRATMDLLSARNKSDFASELGQRIPAPSGAAGIDWKTTVEEFAMAVLIENAERPKVVRLETVAPAYDTPYLVPYLLPENKPTILYGAGGTGKSILAMALAAAVQEGVPVLGWPVEQRNVLYLDWETDAPDIARRNGLVSEGLGLSEPSSIKYMGLISSLTDHETLAAISDAVTEFDIGLVVIDSVVMASPSTDQKDPASGAKDFFSATSILGTTVLAIDHLAGDDMKKPGQVTKPYGSVFKWNIARNVFELRLIDKDDRLLLKHRKSNIGPKMTDKAISLRWDGPTTGGTYFSQEDAMKYEMPIGQRILEVMKSGARLNEVERALNTDDAYEGVTSIDVRSSIGSLVQQGLLYDDGGDIVLTYKAGGMDKSEQPV